MSPDTADRYQEDRRTEGGELVLFKEDLTDHQMTRKGQDFRLVQTSSAMRSTATLYCPQVEGKL